MRGQARTREELRSIRRRGLRLVIPSLPVIVLGVIIIGRAWLWAAFAAWAAIWLMSLASISARIRRGR